jgi:hypothetical protein
MPPTKVKEILESILGINCKIPVKYAKIIQKELFIVRLASPVGTGTFAGD